MQNEQYISLIDFKELTVKGFHKIFKTFYKELCRIAYIITQCKDSAEDVVQKTFISIWENKDSIKINTSIQSYLMVTVKNNSFNYLKSHKIRKDYEQKYYLEIEKKNSVKVNEQVFKEKLEWAINKLPDQCRLVYCLKYQEGLTYNEIASYLSISTNTVDSHIQKALKTLRAQLYKHKEDFYEN